MTPRERRKIKFENIKPEEEVCKNMLNKFRNHCFVNCMQIGDLLKILNKQGQHGRYFVSQCENMNLDFDEHERKWILNLKPKKLLEIKNILEERLKNFKK